MIERELTGQGVYLGRQGEDREIRVYRDIEDWMDEYGTGSGVMLFTSPDGKTWPLYTETDIDSKRIYGTVTLAESAVIGNGCIEARWMSGRSVMCSEKFNAYIIPFAFKGDIPKDATPGWVKELILGFNTSASLLDEARETAREASEAKIRTEEALEAADEAAAQAARSEAAADEAAGEADTAKDAAQNAEAWANGTRDGVDLLPGDSLYNKHAKYWAGQAAASAGEAMAATPEGYADIVEHLAGEYDSGETYSVGDYVLYEAVLYRCSGDTSGDDGWVAGHWTEVILADEAKEALKMIGRREDISDSFTFANGYRINYKTGKRQGPSYTGFRASGYVSVAGYDTLRIRMIVNRNASAYGLAFYTTNDEDGFIADSGATGKATAATPEDAQWMEMTVPIPETAVYVRTTWKSEITDDFKCYKVNEGLLYGEIEGVHAEISALTESTDMNLAGIRTDVEDLRTDLNNLEDLVADGGSMLPDYYFENGYMTERIRTVLNRIADASLYSDSFIWFTDPHIYWYSGSVYNAMQGVKLIRYIRQQTNIRKVICGGDIVGGTGMNKTVCTNNFKKFRAYFDTIWDHMYNVVGNHEWNDPDGSHPDNTLGYPIISGMLVKDKLREIVTMDEYGDYAIEDKMLDVLYVFLASNKSQSIDPGQEEWMAQVLGGISGGTVVVFSHIGINSNGELKAGFAGIAAILDAFNARGEITVGETAYDYAGSLGHVACVISGDNHRDLDTATDGGIPIISTTCDRGPTSTSSEDFNAARAPGTVKEQAIDVCTLDFENNKLYMTRIGGSWNGNGELENPDREYDLFPEPIE